MPKLPPTTQGHMGAPKFGLQHAEPFCSTSGSPRSVHCPLSHGRKGRTYIARSFLTRLSLSAATPTWCPFTVHSTLLTSSNEAGSSPTLYTTSHPRLIMHHCQRGIDSYAHACALRRSLVPLARAQRSALDYPRQPTFYRAPSPAPAKPSLAMRVAAHPVFAQTLFIIMHTIPHFVLSTVPMLAIASLRLLWQSTVALAFILIAILRPWAPVIALLALACVFSPALPAFDMLLALGAWHTLSVGGQLGGQRSVKQPVSPSRKARKRPPPIIVPCVKMEDCYYAVSQ